MLPPAASALDRGWGGPARQPDAPPALPPSRPLHLTLRIPRTVARCWRCAAPIPQGSVSQGPSTLRLAIHQQPSPPSASLSEGSRGLVSFAALASSAGVSLLKARRWCRLTDRRPARAFRQRLHAPRGKPGAVCQVLNVCRGRGEHRCGHAESWQAAGL